jgi:large subunit ribosomal protein L3
MVQQPAASSLSDVTFEEGKHRRCGVVALKVGMLPLWDEWGVRHASTVLMLDECEVVAQKTIDKDGYSALQVC